MVITKGKDPSNPRIKVPEWIWGCKKDKFMDMILGFMVLANTYNL